MLSDHSKHLDHLQTLVISTCRYKVKRITYKPKTTLFHFVLVPIVSISRGGIVYTIIVNNCYITRGDVVVLHDPGNPKIDICKRIVAMVTFH